MTTPAADGFVMPGEWAPHERCWMAWPCRLETWPDDDGMEAARVAYAEVARAISRFEPVTMLCDPAQVAEASLACGQSVRFLPMPLSDSWVRDNGPSFVRAADGRRAGVHWGFNAWGGNYADHGADEAVAGRLLEHLSLPRYRAPLIMEGGSFHVDGEGTVLVTEQCLLNPNRNPALSRAQIETALKDHLGARTVIWLGEGYEEDETDGHIDEIATFVKPGVILTLATDDSADPNAKIFADNLARLKSARDANGRTLEVVTIKPPAPRIERGRRLTLSYTNLYIANGGVVMPSFEDPADAEAQRTVRKLFPGREVIPVPAMDIVRGGGGIHCITQQQPAG